MNWRRSMIGLAISLPVIALLAYGMTQDPNEIPSPLPGRDAPVFDLPVISGDTGRVDLADLRGNVVVVNFWASWCLQCRYEHEDLSAAAVLYRDRNVRFYGVLWRDTPKNGLDWIEMMGGQSYPSLHDDRNSTGIDYGVYGAPETFIIDQNGVVAHKKIGPVTLMELRELIDPLLNAESPSVVSEIERGS